MSTCHTRIPSPVGELLVVRDELGLTAVYLPGGKHPSDDPGGSPRDDTAFDDVRGQLEQYFAGTRREFDLPLHATGTPWQHRVWDELARIPWGETRGYGQLAAQLGAPTAARAVGTANGRNPLSIIVPCHRVVGANGALTGYAGGVAAKQWLLTHEQAVA